MRDGGKESSERVDNGNGNDEDDYGRAIAKIAVAQICESLGFESFQASALENLAEIAVRYLSDLGKASHCYANSSGRTDCNVFDILQGLEDLAPLSSSSDIVGELTEYVDTAEEVPFAQPVANFPVATRYRSIPSFSQIGEAVEVKHIPAWLPAFPDPHTYVHTPMWNERDTDPRKDKIEQAKQRRKAERSLLSLQQRLACNGAVGSTSEELGVEEEEGSPVVLGSKILKKSDKRSSVLETFAPAIEAAKNGVNESEDCERKEVPKRRPVLQFKFGLSKKSIGMPLDLTLQRNCVGNTAPWFGRDDEKDDKKRRAEQILKESMENPQDLAQL